MVHACRFWAILSSRTRNVKTGKRHCSGCFANGTTPFDDARRFWPILSSRTRNVTTGKRHCSGWFANSMSPWIYHRTGIAFLDQLCEDTATTERIKLLVDGNTSNSGSDSRFKTTATNLTRIRQKTVDPWVDPLISYYWSQRVPENMTLGQPEIRL